MTQAQWHAAALVPAYNCEKTIAAVVAGARQFHSTVVVVDDGSGDDTAPAAREAGAEVLRQPRNCGKGAAIRTGLDRLLADQSLTHIHFLDGDGQHDPAYIPEFFTCARKGARFVIGSRMRDRETMPGYRYETNRIGDMILSRMTGQAVEDGQSGFRLVEADLLRRIELRARGYLIENEMLIKCAPLIARFDYVPVRAIYGAPSHYRPFRDTWTTSWGSVFIKVFET